MLNTLAKIFNDTMTGIDGKSYHCAKFSWLGCNVVICAVMIHQAFKGQVVDLMSSAGALSTVATAHGAIIWGTKATEPGPDHV